jgi:hypothetical protein
MLNKEPNADRILLGFTDLVLSNFAFLTDFGLRPVQKDMTFVRYESTQVFLNVYHGRASFELGVEVGRLAEPNEKITRYEIVAFAQAEKTEGLGQHVMFQVSSREGVQEFVPKLARLIKTYGTPFLRGDVGAYSKVYRARTDAALEYEKQVHLRQVRKKAEDSWHAKDYARVAELYGSVRKDLTEVEFKKLSYAEKQAISAGSGSSRYLYAKETLGRVAHLLRRF